MSSIVLNHSLKTRSPFVYALVSILKFFYQDLIFFTNFAHNKRYVNMTSLHCVVRFWYNYTT